MEVACSVFLGPERSYMTILEFSLLVCGSSLLAGLVGALTGLGGGVVLVPLLSLLFKVDIRYAIGASLVSVIATSSGAAAAYVKEGFSNIRIGMFLEIATTLGALLGANLAARVSTHAIAIVFGVVLLFSAEWCCCFPRIFPGNLDRKLNATFPPIRLLPACA